MRTTKYEPGHTVISERVLRFNQKNFASEPKSESVHSSLSIIVLVYVLFYVHEIKDLAINHDDAIREFTVSEFLFFLS